MAIIDKEQMNPTADFISNQHTGNFIKILPDTYIIKGAKNPRGFDQAYAVGNNNRKELLLIDVVEEATREAVEDIKNNGYNIKGIVISGKKVLNDAYADLETISKDAGGADIYIHPDIAPKDGFDTKTLNSNDSKLKEFNLEVQEIPAGRNGEVLIYCNKNGGMLFAGENAKGSSYDEDSFLFTRDKYERQDDELELEKFWKNFTKDFDYLFPRQGKPAIEVDDRTKTTIIDRVGRGK